MNRLLSARGLAWGTNFVSTAMLARNYITGYVAACEGSDIQQYTGFTAQQVIQYSAKFSRQLNFVEWPLIESINVALFGHFVYLIFV